jgi:hypothetical protein
MKALLFILDDALFLEFGTDGDEGMGGFVNAGQGAFRN